LLRLKSPGHYVQNFEYHHSVQGLIYSLLVNTSFDGLHNKRGFKFFSYSNIFSNRYQNNLYNLIIASPSDEFIEQILYQLHKIRDYQIPVEIGLRFELQEALIIKNKDLSFPLQIISGSPILIRIPPDKFKAKSDYPKSYSPIYWRSSHPIQLFIDAVESNLNKKLYDFAQSRNNSRLFTSFTFKKQVSTKIHVNGSMVPVIGSLWQLGFSEEIDKKTQLFALDCGLGERNSLGFGFMNIISRNPN
jgi:CRISPR-associated endoribonuclease Cas6